MIPLLIVRPFATSALNGDTRSALAHLVLNASVTIASCECSIHDDLEQQSLQLHNLGGQWKDKALFDQHIQVSTFHTDGLLPTRPSSKQIVEQTITRMLCHDTFIANSRLAAMKLDDNVDRRYEQSNAIAQRINKNIYEHWIKASNGCGQNIKVQVCYYKTIVMNVPPEIKNAVLGIQPSMKEFQYDAKEK